MESFLLVIYPLTLMLTSKICEVIVLSENLFIDSTKGKILEFLFQSSLQFLKIFQKGVKNMLFLAFVKPLDIMRRGLRQILFYDTLHVISLFSSCYFLLLQRLIKSITQTIQVTHFQNQ